MPITNRSLALIERLRADVGAETDQVVRDLTAAWVGAWDRLSLSWQHAIGDALEVIGRADGTVVPAYLLNRVERLATAVAQSNTALQALATTAAAATTVGAGNVIAATAAAEPGIIAAQLPAAGARAALRRYAARIVPSALEQIATRCREQIHAAHWPLAADAVEAMRRALVTGVATGDNPRVAARQMLAGTESHFNGGLARAIVLARTEVLDAYRATSEHVHRANDDVVASWLWLCALGPRSCSGCWGMHGTEHSLDTQGPQGHQQCRCARMPKVKSWAELGLPFVEDDDQVPDAAAAFAALDPAAQLTIMGPRRLALLKSGRITLADLATRRESAAWRPSYVPTPVGRLVQIAERRTPR